MKSVNLREGEGRSARDKIRTIDQLGEIAAAARAAGQRVVLAHGVFDLVHPGHVRHLEAARRHGDLLMVTLTADEFVNKGPDRPIFPEHIRAEMLAAFEYVDWVGINYAPSSEPVIHAVQPEVYAKGADYATAEEDITGKIATEVALVERYGGRLEITREVTYSSSSLINRHLDLLDPALQAFLERFREEHSLERVMTLLEAAAGLKVLVVGDAIIDEYQYVASLGKSAKEAMIATSYMDRELFAGGVIAAANHAASLCREVEVITLLGDVERYESLIRRNLKENVALTALTRPGAPTTRKTRFVEKGYLRKLFEVYYFDDSPLSPALEAELHRTLEARLDDYDLVIVTDFGHGLISPDTVRLLCRKARFLAVNTQTNSGNAGYNLITRYPRADYICIDAPEARLAVADKHGDVLDIVTRKLPARVDCPRIVVTHGKSGCYAHQAGGEPHHIPAFTKTVVDTVGAGDAFFSITAPLAAAGGEMAQVAFIGNAAGAMKVGIIGHRQSVDKVPLQKYLTALMK